MEPSELKLTEKNSKSQQSPKKKQKTSSKHFQIIQNLGYGAYGQVSLARKDNKLYAMKEIQKIKLQKQKKNYQAYIQREVLCRVKHPGIVQLHYSFQDERSLYFVLEYCQGGGFKDFIQKNYGKLTIQLKTFYIAQIVNVLQYLHKHGITHRDLKPQNIMLSKEGHVKLIDFGTAQISRSDLLSEQFKQNIKSMKKIKNEPQETVSAPLRLSRSQSIQNLASPIKNLRRSTFVGTSFYLSPELLQHNICQSPSDLWALGCILYQMFYLQTPFKSLLQWEVYEKISQSKLEFPKNDTITEDAIDLIKRLLVHNPQERLGSNSRPQLSYSKLKEHPFFKGFNIDTIFSQQIPDAKQTPLKQQEILENNIKVEKSKTQIENSLQLSKDKDVLIYGILQKKTFLTYNMYYCIIYQDLTMKRIKHDDASKFKIVKIKYKQSWSKDFRNMYRQSNQKVKQNIDILVKKQAQKIAKITSENKFQITTEDKTYTFRAKDAQEAKKWVNTIIKKVQFLKRQWLQNDQ